VIYLRAIAIPVLIYIILISGTRYFDVVYPVLDWVLLGICAFLPLADSGVRKNKIQTYVIPIVNALIMFTATFWVIAAIFKEGL